MRVETTKIEPGNAKTFVRIRDARGKVVFEMTVMGGEIFIVKEEKRKDKE